MSRSQRGDTRGGGWQPWASSLLVGLTLAVILLFFLQQVSELGWAI